MQTSKGSFISSNLRLIIVFIIAVIFGVIFWLYKAYYSTPNSVFYGMISNNLNTQNYEVVTDQVGLTGNIIVATQVNSGFKNVVISRETTNIANSKNTVQILSIGTPSTDFSSYQKISVGRSSSLYDSLIGVWGENSPHSPSGQGGQLYQSTVFSAFLFASPSINDTNRLVNFIKQNKVYIIKSSKTANFNGRSIINFQIQVNLKQYSNLLSLYSSLIGYKNNYSINATYPSNQLASLDISVDVLSRQLIGLSYVGSSSVEAYESYGINSPIKLPTKTIPLQQLKNDISSLSN
ncbi:MAG TPA: hypothetical protein VMQ58_02225 [Candidatus Saccharimonadales bacterium]|jgi:hypothetical protein|nr:hypothetical protein [Candidatus Saccharimonadales bacterium]